MNQASLAIGTTEHPILIGDFNITSKNDKIDIYYNIDIGLHRNKIFNVNSCLYDDLENLHRSYHNSGKGHTKHFEKDVQRERGHISDGSTLINGEEDLLIMAIESFNLDQAPKELATAYDILLNKPKDYSKFSILWLFVPPWYSETLPYRMVWGNFWGIASNTHFVRTSSLSDILITHKMIKVLTINNWSVCACFLRAVLPVVNSQTYSLLHPKGQEYPWRAFNFVDAHLPLSNMIQAYAMTKRAVLTSHRPWSSEVAAHPSAWVKYSS